MPLEIAWSVEGEKQLSRRLRQVEASVSDLSKPFEQSAKKLKKVYEKDVFETEGGSIDEHWQRLSPRTVAAKARKGYKQPTKPLVATGDMQKGFRYKTEKDHAVIWNIAEYFKYHQTNKGSRKHLPRRVMLKLAEKQRQLVVRTFNKYFRETLK